MKARLKKGSPAAKAYMAKIRGKKKKVGQPSVKVKSISLKKSLKSEGLKLPHGYSLQKRVRINGPQDVASTITKLYAIKDGIRFHENLKKASPPAMRKKHTTEIAAMKKSFAAMKKYLQTQTNSIK